MARNGRSRFLRPAGLVLSVLVIAGSLGAHAQEGESSGEGVLFGVWTLTLGDSFHPLWPASYVCVQATGRVHLQHPSEAHTGYGFEPSDAEPVCLVVSGGFDYEVEEAPGEFQVAVMRTMPRALDRPGVTPLPDEGHGIRVSGVTPRGELAMTHSPGLEAIAFSWPALLPLMIEQDGGERFVATGGASGDVVVLVQQPGGAQGFLRWSEPVWYEPAPDLGQVLTPVALALLVALFRGGAGGGFVRPAQGKRTAGEGRGASGEP